MTRGKTPTLGEQQALLACPACAASLKTTQEGVLCERCGARYLRKQGVLSFLAGQKASDFENQWRLWTEKKLGSSERVYGHSQEEHLLGILSALRISREALSGLNVLDAGSGHGMISRAFSSEGANVVAMDLTGEGFAPLSPDGPLFILADYLFAPFKPLSFDIVISSGVVHHTEDPFVSLACITRYLKKGVLLYLYLYEPKAVKSLKLRRIFPLSYKYPRTLLRLVAWVAGLPMLGLKRALGRRQETLSNTVLGIHDVLAPRWSHEIRSEKVTAFLGSLGFEEVERVSPCVYRAMK
jgi:SAM-dependent methyltransferase